MLPMTNQLGSCSAPRSSTVQRLASRHAALSGLITGALLFITGCSTVNPYFDSSRPHHTPEGFRNTYSASVNKPFSDLLRWRLQALRDGLPRPPEQLTPTVHADAAALRAWAQSPVAQQQPTATWLGHSTVLVQASGFTTLTDPHFGERASPLSFAGPKRAQPPGLAVSQLPVIDVVLVSHNHYDHLDDTSIRALAVAPAAHGRPLFVVPLGMAEWIKRRGIDRVVELDWWDRIDLARDAQGLVQVVKSTRSAVPVTPGPSAGRTLEVVLTPVQHWSARSLGDRNQSLWGGFAVLGDDFHWYFSGDTGYSRDFVDTRNHFAQRHALVDGGGFDLALIAIGAYEPRWFMKEQHVNPAEAVQIHLDLGAKRSLGVHWGTFSLTDEALDQPPKDLAVARQQRGLSQADFDVMAVGETRRYPRRASATPGTTAP
jgi:N-acyl-phosphatidylethanolamine-hydrolysing phospholipase D